MEHRLFESLKASLETPITFRAWHVSPHHIVAAESASEAIGHARSIGLDEADGLYPAALELNAAELALPCSTGDGSGNQWRDATISTFLEEVSEARLLCETCPRTSYRFSEALN